VYHHLRLRFKNFKHKYLHQYQPKHYFQYIIFITSSYSTKLYPSIMCIDIGWLYCHLGGGELIQALIVVVLLLLQGTFAATAWSSKINIWWLWQLAAAKVPYFWGILLGMENFTHIKFLVVLYSIGRHTKVKLQKWSFIFNSMLTKTS